MYMYVKLKSPKERLIPTKFDIPTFEIATILLVVVPDTAAAGLRRQTGGVVVRI
jgi:hypothetical protein